MASDSTLVRVFLASPSGLNDERILFRESIAAFNEAYGHEAGFVFVPVGWEQVPSGVGRPQGQINKVVRAADYVVAVIWDRWGTATTRDAAFSSGTQEELATAIECLADPNAPMRDIAIYFRAVDDRQLADAGPQLTQVIDFKRELESSKQLLYNTFDKLKELEQLLMRQLRSWQREFSDKIPQQIEIPQLSRSSANEMSDSNSEQSITQHLARAQDLERQGLVTEAEIAYATAVSEDDRGSLVGYAKFLRRTGRLEHAIEINERILRLEALDNVDLNSSAAERSTVLANIAVIERKQGKLEESRRHLEEAIVAAQARKDYEGQAAEAYAQDNLGLTLRGLGDVSGALKRHETALDLRQELGDEVGIAKCAINIGRMLREQGALTGAREQIENAIATLEGVDDELHTLANAYSTLGDIALAEVDLEAALRHFGTSLRLNDQLGHSDGAAIVCGQLADLLLSTGKVKEARPYAERCLDINERSGNLVGSNIALQRLEEIDFLAES